jgi:hypothetical protein
VDRLLGQALITQFQPRVAGEQGLQRPTPMQLPGEIEAVKFSDR